MNKQTFKVIKGYSELSYDERKKVRETIEKYEKEEISKRSILLKGLFESVGPLDQDTCPCCGR